MVKLSDTPIKTSTPGILQVRRFSHDGRSSLDVVYDQEIGPPLPGVPASDIDPLADVRVELPDDPDITGDDLLVPILRAGKRATELPSTAAIRERAQAGLAKLPDAVRRFDEPDRYPVALEPRLADLKRQLITSAEASP
jgi:nicotinate phosphoribosyltransferase